MELYDYIDWDEGREDASVSAAVNICENCGQACEELHDLAEWNFQACDECAEEAAREDAREAEALRQARTQTALPFAPKPCVHCKTRISRWDSIYCSDFCKREFLASFSEVA
jgi:hypothetical protein